MNEVLGFLGMMRAAGWVFLCAVFVVAMGLFLFDRRAGAPAAEQAEPSEERRAA